jgi:hypothetical protein
MSFLDDGHFGYIKTSFFYFSLYFEGSPPAEDHQGVMQWGRSCYISMFPCSHGTIFDGTDQENSKTQGGRGQIRKIQENKKEMMEETKRRDLCVCGGSHTRVFAIGWGCPGLPPLCDPPSGEPTHMGTSLMTSQDWKKNTLLLSSS